MAKPVPVIGLGCVQQPYDSHRHTENSWKVWRKRTTVCVSMLSLFWRFSIHMYKVNACILLYTVYGQGEHITYMYSYV